MTDGAAAEPPLRLLIIASQYPPAGRAGLEHVTQRLAQGLGRCGHSVHILTSHVPGLVAREEEAPGLVVHRVLRPLTLGPLWGLTYMAQVGRWMKRLATEWDLVLTQQLYLHTAVARRMADRLGKRCAARLVNTGEYSDIANLRAHRGGAALLRAALRSDAFFALSADGARELAGAGVEPARIWRFYNPVDVEHFSPAGQPEQGLLVCVGRLDRQKNVPHLIETFGRVAARHAGARLLIAGSGPAEPEVRAALHASPAHGRIELAGWSENPAALYRRAWAVVTATITEGLSNVLLEALACGAPVVTPDVSGVREVLEIGGAIPAGGFVEGRGGLVAKIGDGEGLAAAMEALLADAARRERLAAQGRRRILESYALGVAVERFAAAARAILAGTDASDPALRFDIPFSQATDR